MKRALPLLFAFITPSLHFVAFSQQPQQVNAAGLKFDAIGADQGLALGSMTGMLTDKRGFVWLISNTGIARYDGYEFKVFKTDPENHQTISAGKAMNCTEDNDGNIWVACDIPWGLNCYSPKSGKFTRYSESSFFKKNFPSGNIWKMLFDKQNILWICMEGQGIFSWDQKTNKIRHWVHNPEDSSSLADNNVWDAAFDSSGSIYFCTPDNIDLLNVHTGKFSHYPLHLTTKHFMSHTSWDLGIFVDRKDSLWIITPEGLKSFNPLTRQLNSYQRSDKENSIRGTHIYNICDSPDGRIWITSDSGLNIYDPTEKTFTFFNHDNDDPHSIAPFQFGPHYDRSGIMWVQGKNLLNKTNLISQKFRTAYSWPSCFFQDNDGQIILGHYYGGVTLFDPKSRLETPFAPDHAPNNNLSGSTLQTIFKDKDSVYWFGVDFNRLVTYDPKKKNWNVYRYKDNHHPDSLGVGEILAPVYQDRSSNIWFCGNYGISKYDPATKKFKNYLINYERGMAPINSVVSVFDPGDGRLWFGSEGFSYYKQETDTIVPKVFNENKSAKILSESRINCTFNAGNGRMWVGTMGNGLFLLDFKTGQCKRISTKDGLPSDQIFGIMRDRIENLWLITGNGLCKYRSPSNGFDEKEKPVLRNYNKSDGLPANPSVFIHPLNAKDGSMYFVSDGGSDGLVYFNPDSLVDNPFRPPVFITDFALFNKSVSPSDSNSVLRSTIETTTEIKLNYRQNVISFSFSALSFINPEKNQYAYKLDNFDKEWTYTDATRRVAKYTNLDPGDYTFEVKASNNDGIWNELPTKIHLLISPPFWQTWWFRLLIVLMVGALIYGLYSYRVRELIQLQNIRNRISGDLHDDIGSTLNSISIYSEVAKQAGGKHAEALEMIGEASRRIIDAMSDIVWTINPDNDSFENIILRMRSLTFNLLRAKNIEFTFKVDESLNKIKLPMETRRNLFLLFKEAINNLVKYAEATIVTIQLIHEGTWVKMIISDNGKGFDTSLPPRGNGLNSMKRRSKEMKAALQVRSEMNQGTTIELILKP